MISLSTTENVASSATETVVLVTLRLSPTIKYIASITASPEGDTYY